MSGAAEMGGIDIRVLNSFDRFGQQNLFDSMNHISRQDLRAESKWFEVVGNDSRSIDRSESGQTIHYRLQRDGRDFETLFPLSKESGDVRNRRNHRIRDWLNNRLQPLGRIPRDQ